MRMMPLLLLAAIACTDKSDVVDSNTGVADADGDGYDVETDCDDEDASVNPGAEETPYDGLDNDCDEGTPDDDLDADGFGADEDCDDADPSVYPDAVELCDGVDNDCDGEIDDAVGDTWYSDADGDGFGDPETATEDCDGGGGLVANASDCDDTEAAVNPDADELCNGVDDNCDGTVDEGSAVDAPTWYSDSDADGFGDPAAAERACEQPSGAVSDSADCDDADAAVNPDATELCDDVDNNCDGQIDEDSAADASTWYADADADGYGDPSASSVSCEAPSGSVADATDCDDGEALANPGLAEVCDSIDNNCDGDVDEGVTTTFYGDADGDGYGDASVATEACAAPSGSVADATDCDDGEPLANPGEAEVCDSIDNNCDGDVDEGVTVTWYTDSDGDGYGDSGSSGEACAAPSGTATLSGDCDDADASYNPGASLGCDGEDYDCDGQIDNDADGDTYADASCGGGDCDDSDASILPDSNGLCALGLTCDDILSSYASSTDGSYVIDPDGYGSGLDPFTVTCDMSTDGGGWTEIAYAADLAFGQQYTGGDRWFWLADDFTFVLSDAQIAAIQALSTEGTQQYVGLCEHVLHYYYTSSASYAYAFGFRFFDGTETAHGLADYSPHDITVSQDGCAVNGGEGGTEANSTIFEINSVLVPLLNVEARDAGDVRNPGEEYGSPLTSYPAYLR